jgi:hypothetical protein
MKSNVILMLITVLFIMTSCDDIVNSDSNIKKTSLDYSYVLDNQETGVIMPLKVGYKWLYSVDKVNEENVAISNRIDSIVVLREVMLENEKWFEVYFPMFSREYNVLMTNTDKGLIIYCEQCLEKKFLWAEYPKFGSLYYAGMKLFQLKNQNGDVIGEDFVSIGKESHSSGVSLQNGKNFSTVNYTAYSLEINKMQKEVFLGYEHFSPDFGLVAGYSKPMQGILGEQYEYLEFSNNSEVNTCIIEDYINLGEVQIGKVSSFTKEITNNTDKSYNLKGIAIITATEIISFGTITPTMHNWLNFPIRQNQKLSIEIKVTPDKLGDFSTSVMIVHSEMHNCFYRIYINGTCVE